MKIASLVLGIVFMLLAILTIPVLANNNANKRLAEEHYTESRLPPPDDTPPSSGMSRTLRNLYKYYSKYGCDDDNCPYCNGREVSEISDFAYYQTVTLTVKWATALLVIFLVLSIANFIVFYYIAVKDERLKRNPS